MKKAGEGSCVNIGNKKKSWIRLAEKGRLEMQKGEKVEGHGLGGEKELGGRSTSHLSQEKEKRRYLTIAERGDSGRVRGGRKTKETVAPRETEEFADFFLGEKGGFHRKRVCHPLEGGGGESTIRAERDGDETFFFQGRR